MCEVDILLREEVHVFPPLLFEEPLELIALRIFSGDYCVKLVPLLPPISEPDIVSMEIPWEAFIVFIIIFQLT